MGIFGSNNNQDDQAAYVPDDTAAAAPAPDQTQPSNIDGFIPGAQTPADTTSVASDNDFTSVTAPPVTTDDTPGEYIMTDAPAETHTEESAVDVSEPVIDVTPTPVEAEEPAPVEEEEPVPVETPTHETPIAVSGSDDLSAIKQQALQQLSPLVNHLDQSPEEKFHTTMMMLQATDDQSLVRPAYEAAQAITDEKTRAQALLDIVNEINYFTQQKS